MVLCGNLRMLCTPVIARYLYSRAYGVKQWKSGQMEYVNGRKPMQGVDGVGGYCKQWISIFVGVKASVAQSGCAVICVRASGRVW